MSENNNKNEDNQISKHKESGKHALSHDSIFKGKKEEPLEESYTETYFNDDFRHDPGSLYHHESINHQDYIREKDLKEKVFKILSDKTELNFENNRRKPSRIDFNIYYSLLREELDNDKFTYTEIFNELAYYFSDNLLNMLKLLDNKWRANILTELSKHVGEIPDDWDEVKPKNLTIQAEIEFEIEVEVDPSEIDIMTMDDEDCYETRLITGVIVDINKNTKEYTVNSFQDTYIVPLECITQIFNNRKHKYNLNKLNNLDIL
jgi:hypothetical protein